MRPYVIFCLIRKQSSLICLVLTWYRMQLSFVSCYGHLLFWSPHKPNQSSISTHRRKPRSCHGFLLFFFMNNNFQQWKYNMLVALETKGEECFVLDNLPCLPSPVSWQRCNKMVIYWFTHFVPPLSSNLYVDGTRFWYIVWSSSTILPWQ